MDVMAEGIVAPQVLADGSEAPMRLDRTGAVIMVEGHGRYYEAASRGNLFTAYAAAGAVTTVATSMTGLILVNNSTTTKAALQKIGGLILATSASATGLVLAWFQVGAPGTKPGVGYGASTATALTAVPNYLGGNLPQCGVYSAVNSTVGTPVPFKTLLHNTAAIAVTGEDIGFQMDLEGSIIVPPGFGVCVAALGAATAATSTVLDLSWEEIPLTL